MTRSPAQGSACKDLERNGQSPAITLTAAYTPIPTRAGSRSPKKGCSCFLAGTSFLNT
ncbi:acetyltransferase [Lacticaseibacillus rhamnosus]|nr:acetyltransferase [Lacticaseibacillus rhamnosus]